MRARYPEVEDTVVRDGARIGYEVYEPTARAHPAPTVLLLPSMPLVHARQWKAQIPFLAREHRVVAVDGRGNGRSDRPTSPAAFALAQQVADLVAVLDATATERAVAVGASAGARLGLELATARPDRVCGVVAIAPTVMFPDPGFEAVREEYQSWERFNRHYISADLGRFAEWFFGECYSDPHSTKPLEDALGWAAETTAETFCAYLVGNDMPHTLDEARDRCAAVRCPVLVVHGTDDRVVPHALGVAVAEWTGGTLVSLEGVGHFPAARDPVQVNLRIREFVRSVTSAPPPARRWRAARARPRRALFLSSPIGLGHARRDLAVADELRARHPDLEIEWLTQHPVTALLGARGERIHPASRLLAGESGHVESVSGEHDLHAFGALRTMDEILLANFHVLAEVADAEQHDLWVGDEAWDLDHFLHENPELKSTPYAWMTDFVGFLPMADGGEREAALTADYNAEMLEHVDRYPRLRDRALFVGDPEDVVEGTFGPGMPAIRDWTREHYAFPGYISGFTPIAPREREEIRAELGWAPGEPVCLVTAGGTGVGLPLLRRVRAALPEARRRVPGLRTVIVTGPRIAPETIEPAPGLEVHGWVPDLYRRLAACDMAVTHGGLTTTMELTANRRPFVYVPLRHHFEQNLHVPHRLARHRAGRRMDWAELTPDGLADAVAAGIAAGAATHYRPVDPGGAARAAELLAELL